MRLRAAAAPREENSPLPALRRRRRLADCMADLLTPSGEEGGREREREGRKLKGPPTIECSDKP